MKKTNQLLLTALLLAANLGCLPFAQGSEANLEPNQCAHAEAGALVECLAIQILVSELDLTTTFGSLVGKASLTPAATALSNSQDKWKAYRDAQCDLQGLELPGYVNGQPNPMSQSCRLSMNLDRIASLRSIQLPVRPARAER